MKRLFHDYGGLEALVGSPYFLFSLIFAIFSANAQENRIAPVVESIIGAVPTILGVSVAALTVFVAFMSSKIVDKESEISSVKKKKVPMIVASLCWPVIVQSVTLLFAYFVKFGPWDTF